MGSVAALAATVGALLFGSGAAAQSANTLVTCTSKTVSGFSFTCNQGLAPVSDPVSGALQSPTFTVVLNGTDPAEPNSVTGPGLTGCVVGNNNTAPSSTFSCDGGFDAGQAVTGTVRLAKPACEGATVSVIGSSGIAGGITSLEVCYDAKPAKAKKSKPAKWTVTRCEGDVRTYETAHPHASKKQLLTLVDYLHSTHHCPIFKVKG
ncbi:MAG TPA: hypothetical protein VHX88_19905 [Solirubrobacteraceae bacterium]|nr:hypothetical protein [Solirubrobacteraceae bacterium]